MRMTFKSLVGTAAIAAISMTVAFAQTTPATQPTALVNPDTTGLSGISGPGAPFSVSAPVFRQRYRANSPAVRNGLIPNIRPLMDLHIRDTIVILGGDGNYYMTGSTGDDIWRKGDGIELWKSPDLKSWTYMGLVWSIQRDGAEWNKNRPNPRYGVSIWAPEIVYIKNNYYLTYSQPPGDRGILKSTTGKPEGPYVSALAGDGRLAGEIDASLFEDDDGSVYLVYAGGFVAKMKDDMSGLTEEPRKPILLNPDMDPNHHATTCPPRRNCQDIGREGGFLFKKDGKYYMTAADTYDGRYSTMVAISDNIYGPYDHRHEAVPCGGGTDYFMDKEGNWYCAFFGNDGQAPWREMPAIVKVQFAADGRISIADEQPAWLLHEGAPQKWRPSTRPSTNQ